MSNERNSKTFRRRDEILRETDDLVAELVLLLDQQQKLAANTETNLLKQNFLLVETNEKLRSMNDDLNQVLQEINEIESKTFCFCFRSKRSTNKANLTRLDREKFHKIERIRSKTVEQTDPQKRIDSQIKQVEKQLVLFRDQIQTINETFQHGDQIIEQLNDQTDRYIYESSDSST